jgi:hypothetical protein
MDFNVSFKQMMPTMLQILKRLKILTKKILVTRKLNIENNLLIYRSNINKEIITIFLNLMQKINSIKQKLLS